MCSFYEKSFIHEEKTSKIGLDGIDELLIFGIRKINLARIHLEDSAIIRTIDILGSKMEVEMAQLVTISSVVNLLGIEGALHGTSSLSHISHEIVALLVVEFIKVVDMLIIADEATATVCLLLEKEKTRNTKVANLDHEIVQGLIVGTIKTRLRIAVHKEMFFEWVEI